MFVNIKDNKWQIIISSIIGALFYNITENIGYSLILVLLLSVLLRKLNIDNYISYFIGNIIN